MVYLIGDQRKGDPQGHTGNFNSLTILQIDSCVASRLNCASRIPAATCRENAQWSLRAVEGCSWETDSDAHAEHSPECLKSPTKFHALIYKPELVTKRVICSFWGWKTSTVRNKSLHTTPSLVCRVYHLHRHQVICEEEQNSLGKTDLFKEICYEITS